MNTYHYCWLDAGANQHIYTITGEDMTTVLDRIRRIHANDIWEIIYIIKVQPNGEPT